MPLTLQPYPAYKPSSVPWLGDVPAHWEVVQLGRSAFFPKAPGERRMTKLPMGYPVSGMETSTRRTNTS